MNLSVQRVAGEFLVNTVTESDQGQPSVARLAHGGFVVTWTDWSGAGGDASSAGIKAQLFDATGVKQGGEFLVNTSTASAQFAPMATGLSSGGFVVTWQDEADSSIRAQVFDAAGAALGAERVVNTQNLAVQQAPAVAPLTDGGFVVTWQDASTLGDGRGESVKAQIFDAAGAPRGGEFPVHADDPAWQGKPTVAGLPQGGFVVGWEAASAYLGDRSESGVHALVFDAAGARLGPAFRVNTQTIRSQELPHVAVLSDGGFVFTWQDRSATLGDTQAYSIKAQIFDATGAKRGDEFLVNPQTAGSQENPRVAALSDGGFVVTWVSGGPKAQAFDAAGARLGPEFQVPAEAAAAQHAPAISALPDGGFVVSWMGWSETGGDTSGLGIRAQLFRVAENAAPTAIGLIGGVIDEGAAAGTVVGRLSVQDPDIADSHVVSIIGDETGGGFAIQDGKLVVADPSKLDHEAHPAPRVTLQAEDASGALLAQEVTVQLRDVNEAFRVTRVGEEFLVNTEQTEGWQREPVMTGLANGGFVVTWASDFDTLGDGWKCIVAQVFDPSGTKIGEEFRVNTQTRGDQLDPAVTALPDGGFVIAWWDYSRTLGDDSSSSVKAQLFDPAGAPRGGEFLVNTEIPNNQSHPALAALSGGGFVATWLDGSGTLGDVSGTSIKAQIFDATGARIGGEFLVNTETLGLQLDVRVTGLADGGFAITWADLSGTLDDPSGASVKAQIFEANGARRGNEFLVNTQTGGDQREPAITGLADGGFVVTWTDFQATTEDASGYNIKAQRFAGDGARVGAEFLVNNDMTLYQSTPDVAAMPDGGFVISWASGGASYYGVDGDMSVRAQAFDAAGQKIGSEFVVNTNDFNGQMRPAIASLPDQGFVISWMDFSLTLGDTSGTSIKTQIFQLEPVLPTNAGPDLLAVSGFVGPEAVLHGGAGEDTLLADAATFDPAASVLNIETLAVAGGRITLGAAQWSGLETLRAATPGETFHLTTTTPGPQDFSGLAVSGLVHLNLTAGDDTLRGLDAALPPGRSLFVDGQGGNDRMEGTEAAETLSGNHGGNDTLLGFGGDDMLAGGSGTNLLEGGAGDDRLLDQGISSTLRGGAGNDLLQTSYLSSGDAVTQVETQILIPDGLLMEGGEGDDHIINQADARATMRGGEGNDRFNVSTRDWQALEGGAGNDSITLFGPEGPMLYHRGDLEHVRALHDAAGPVLGPLHGGEGEDSLILANKQSVAVDWAFDPNADITGIERLVVNTYGSATPRTLTLSAAQLDGLTTITTGGAGELLYLQASTAGTYDLAGMTVSGLTGITGAAGGVTILANRGDLALDQWFFLLDGSGDDLIVGTAGQDGITSSAGQDTIRAGEGNDQVHSAGPGVLVEAGGGHDWVRAGGADATLLGGAGNDVLIGQDGAMLEGEAGDDHLSVGGTGGWLAARGGAGDDLITITNSGPGLVDGGEGRNSVMVWGAFHADVTFLNVEELIVRSPTTLTPTQLASFGAILGGTSASPVTLTLGAPGVADFTGKRLGGLEMLTGSVGGDVIRGLDPDWVLGILTITGREGDDSIEGSAFRDNMTGDAGHDTLLGLDGDDFLFAGDGDNRLEGGAGNDLLNGSGDGRSLLLGGEGDDFLFGGDGPAQADTLDGGAGQDTLVAGQGAETLTGGTGQDRFMGRAAELDGDRITDYEAEEVILIRDAAFTADDVTLTQGSTIISVDTDQDGDTDLTLTLDLDLPELQAMGLVLDVTQTAEGTEIRFIPGPTNAGPDLLTVSGAVGAEVVLDGGAGEDTLLADAAVFDPGARILDIETLAVVGNFGSVRISAEQLAGFSTLRSTTPGQSFGIIATTPGVYDLTSFTLQGLGYVEGSSGDDTIQGASGDLPPDQILGLRGGSGNDLVLGRDGADNIYDDAGNNTLRGGGGNDFLGLFGTATGVMEGDAGDDTLMAGSSSTPLAITARGGAGNDLFSILGIGGEVNLEAGEGQDWIQVSANPGSAVTLTLDAGAGNDQLSLGGLAAGSVVDGGAGEDSLTLIGPLDPGVTLRNIEALVVTTSQSLSAAQLASLSRIDSPETAFVALSGTTAGLYDFTNIAASRVFSFEGSDGDDTIRGLTNRANLTGGAGHDRIEGNDLGGVMLGGAGDDTLIGGSGADLALGGDGDDVIEGGSGADNLSGGAGHDVMLGGDGADFITDLEGGDDTLIGGEGNDQLYAGEGTNRVEGGAGDDWIYGPDTLPGMNWVDAGSGNDNVSTGLGDDTILGGEGNDTVFAGAGHNHVTGGEGDDSLAAGAGDDTLLGGAGNDFLSTFTGTNLVEGGEGNDTIFGGGIEDTLRGGDGHDNILGPGLGTLIEGGEGDDTILAQGGRAEGGAGNDSLSGSAAELVGGEGDDTILATGGRAVGGEGNDRLSGLDAEFDGGEGNDTLLVSVSGPLGASVARGGEGDDLFQIGAFAPSIELHGGAGQDELTLQAIWTQDGAGGAGFTFTLDPGLTITGIETLTLGLSQIFGFVNGSPTLMNSSAGLPLGISAAQLADVTTIIGPETEGVRLQATTAGHYDLSGKALTGALQLTGSAGDDTLTGTTAADTLQGGEGDDVLIGGAGSDLLEGGAGFDTAVFAGRRADYTINFAPDGTLSLAETDTLRGIERLLFVDMSVQQGASGGQTIAAAGDTPAALEGGGTDDSLLGGGAADTLNGGAGSDTLTGGAGLDQFAGTVAELDGDRIADYEAEEVILVEDARFTAEDVTLTQGSTIISVDTDEDGTPDLTVTLDLDLPDLLAMGLILKVTDTPEGTEISFVPAPSLAITADAPSQAEATATYSFTVTRTGETFAASSANWTVTGADAEDFAGGVLPSGTVTFAPGELSQTITLAIANDAVVEADEGFTITLSDAVGATLDVAMAEGVIRNDDASFSIVANSPGVLEGDAFFRPYSFSVIRTGDLSDWASVDYTALSGTAIGFVDFDLAFGTVSFGPGVSSASIAVPVIGDRLVEADEDFTVTISNAISGSGSAVIGTATAEGVILDDDVLTFDIAADVPALAEGDTGVTPYSFTVTRSGDAFGESSVNWSVQGGTASGSTDFVSNSGLLTFGFGETTQTITILLIGDGQVEGDESFTVTLENPIGAVINTATAEGVILNDDASILSIAADAPGVLEGNDGATPYSFTVTRSGDTSGVATGFVMVQSGTGSSSTDFIPIASAVVFNPGETTQTITVQVIGDTVVEGDESFTVFLTGVEGATLGTDTALGVIRNDDAATYSISAPAAVTEGNSGLTPYVFTVTRDTVADQDVVLDWVFTSITTSSADVQVPAGQLVFGAYQTTATITVNIIGDTLLEGDESFTITLLDPGLPTVILGTATATGVIEDDDAVLAPPSTPDLAAASDLGLSDSDNLTADLTPTLTGTAPIGSTVTLYEGGEVIGSGVALDGSWSITTIPLAAGPRSITATATLGGVTSEASAPLMITLDATAPTLTIAVDDPVLNGAETGTFTFTASEAITGLTADDLVVIGGTLGALSTSDNITFTASFTPTAGFAGPAGISIAAGRYADAAGNAGQADSLGFAVDTLAPAAPVIGAISTDTDTPGDFVTSDRTLSFSGTAEAGSTVTLTLAGATLGSVLAVGGAWSFDHSATTLPLGDLLLTAEARDAAGNVSGLDSQIIRIFGGAVVTPCLTSWGQHYTGSIGNDSFCISGSDNSVTSGDGDDLIRMRGWRNVIDAGAGNDTIEAGQGRARVDAGSGDNVIRLEGWDNLVTAGPGDNHISGAQGRTRVTLGDGDSTVQITGWDNRIEAGIGRLTVSGPQGEAVVLSAGGSTAITLGGWRNEVRVGLGESHVIDAGRGQAKVIVAGGDATITARGTGNEIRTGDGDDIISGLEGAGFVWAGDGDNRVSASGWWNRIETGAGDDQIIAGAGGAQVRAGAGDDVVRLAGWHNRVEAGAGDDTIFGGEGGEVFVLNAAGEGVDQIFDFGADQGDKLELRGVARHQLQVEETGQDLSVQVGGTEVAVLMGQGDLTLEELLAQGSLVFL